jgi:hypothetical protein
LQRPITPVLYILIAIGVLAGFHAVGRRYSVEQHNRRVELALEYTEVNNLSQLTGQPMEQTLARFKAAGITSLALTEETLAGLDAQGELHVQHWDGGTTVTVSSPETLERIKHSLNVKGLKTTEDRETKNETVFEASTDEAGEEAADTQRPPGFAVPVDWLTIRPLGIGLDPQAVEETKKAGLIPVGRIGALPVPTPTTMAAALDDLKKQGVQTVVFQGLEVMGFRGQFKEAVEAFKASGLNFGQVEFGKQKGDEQLGIALKGEYIRVHSIGDAEMSTLDENEAIDRFVRAARERNIRLCYLRFFTTGGPDPIGTNVEYIQKISKGIARGREMDFGPAHIYEETGLGSWVFGLIAVGVAAGLTLLLIRIAPVSNSAVVLTLAASLIACIAAAMFLGESGRRLVALLAALVYPTLACLRRDLLTPGSANRLSTLNAGGSMVAAIKGIIEASLVTAIGIVSVVGLLASRPFIVKANQFLGIKAAHAVPLLIIGALAIAGLPRLDRSWSVEKAALKERLGRFFSEPMRVGQLVLALVALIVLAMIVARTGNEPGVGVSGIELKFRALLDKILPVRPRTKEFLIGHPAFIFALALWYRGRRKWAIPLFVVGVIGQVSILNTFCHTHTPLHLSLIRDLTGLVFGTVIGLVVFWLTERIWREPVAAAVRETAPPAPLEA